jgi:hypothetical protein
LSGDRSLNQPNKDIDILRRMRAVAADPDRMGQSSPLPSKEKRFPALTVFQ